MSTRLRVGITLPSFVEDPEVPLAVARAAEDAGLDGVFVYDHLFRITADGRRRPALEATALLGAIAAATTRVMVGTLVFRAWLRPPATLGAAVASVARIAPGRVLVGIGAGDSQSKEENESFGLGFGSLDSRVGRLDAAVRHCRDGGAQVWVGGQHPRVIDVAATSADGWNAWGDDVAEFERGARAVRSVAVHDPFTCSWGGLCVVDRDDDAAAQKAASLPAVSTAVVGGPETVARALAAYRDAGAGWAVLGPLDASDPVNATLLGEVVALL